MGHPFRLQAAEVPNMVDWLENPPAEWVDVWILLNMEDFPAIVMLVFQGL